MIDSFAIHRISLIVWLLPHLLEQIADSRQVNCAYCGQLEGSTTYMLDVLRDFG